MLLCSVIRRSNPLKIINDILLKILVISNNIKKTSDEGCSVCLRKDDDKLGDGHLIITYIVCYVLLKK